MSDARSNPTSLPAVDEAVPSALAPRLPEPIAQRSLQLLQGAGRALARSVPMLQYQLTRAGALGISGLLAMVAAIVVALTVVLPQHSAVNLLQLQLRQPAMPGVGRDANTGTDAAKLLTSLPTRSQIPVVLALLVEQADKAGVVLDHGHYDYRAPQGGSLGRYGFEFPIKGEYTNIRDFIGRALAAVPAAGLDKLHIERHSVADPVINADIGFIVYVRGD